jgi:hypothetical protein
MAGGFCGSEFRQQLRSGLLFFHCAANVDEIVGDHTEPDPTLHSSVAFVAAAVEPVSPLDQPRSALLAASNEAA